MAGSNTKMVLKQPSNINDLGNDWCRRTSDGTKNHK